MKVSIIIPVYNQLEFLERCLKKIEENTGPIDYEIIICDDRSNEPNIDNFYQKLPFKVIRNNKRLFFAKTCNKGAREAKGDIFLFLNSDTEPEKNWLAPMVNLINSSREIGIVGSKLLYPDRTIQHIGVYYDLTLKDGMHYHKRENEFIKEAVTLRECEAVTGACLMIRKQLFDALGGFDERFYHGWEDLDLCFRVRRAGLKIYYCPESVLIHHEGKSNANTKSWKARYKERKNRLIFNKRWGEFIKDYEAI